MAVALSPLVVPLLQGPSQGAVVGYLDLVSLACEAGGSLDVPLSHALEVTSAENLRRLSNMGLIELGEGGIRLRKSVAPGQRLWEFTTTPDETIRELVEEAGGPPGSPTRTTIIDFSDPGSMNPDFAAHFTDDLYVSESLEFAPFGNDMGWEILHGWGDLLTHGQEPATIREVLDAFGFSELERTEASPGEEPSVDVASIVLSAAFALARQTGRLSSDDIVFALNCVDILINSYGEDPVLVRQREDLKSWRPEVRQMS